MTAIQEIAREIDITLVDKYYLNAISSGVLIKAQDEGFTNDLQQAYIAIENCKTKFRQIALHFQRIISAPRNEPTAVQLAEIALRERVPAEIENAVKHMDLSLGKVEKALESLNRVLSPYGKQFTVDDSDN